jgi:hypothetical protein
MFILFLLLSGKISLWYGGALRRAVRELLRELLRELSHSVAELLAIKGGCFIECKIISTLDYVDSKTIASK